MARCNQGAVGGAFQPALPESGAHSTRALKGGSLVSAERMAISMSRAFVKEHDGDSPGDDLPESPVTSGPNYVTPKGLADLEARLAAA